MLSRQKAALSVLAEAGSPLSPTAFVKLMFLVSQEPTLQSDQAFYEFVPYKFGPFSFVLYHELDDLRRCGYVAPKTEMIELCASTRGLTVEKVDELPDWFRSAVKRVVAQYGSMSHQALLDAVYAKYPWYTINSELIDSAKADRNRPQKAKPAVYTAGYENTSVDAFLSGLIKAGIEMIVDVRANAVSRKYGFSGTKLGDISRKLGVDYRHYPQLGIPSNRRTGLGSKASYQSLLRWYGDTVVPTVAEEIAELARLMKKTASVLVCAEGDARCCHRSRLAVAISRVNELEVRHL